MATLNVATSIVDFLKSRGLRPTPGEKFPLFDTRSQLFNRLGLGTEGTFRGTKDQNTALLRALQQSEKSTGITITTENIFDVGRVGQAGGTQAPPPLQETPAEDVLKQAEGEPRAQQQVQAQAQPPTAVATQQQAQQFPLAEGLLPQIPGVGDVAQQALEQVQGGLTFPLRQEAAEAEREAIRLGAQRQKEEFIRNIASRGLFFSGAKKRGVQTIEADQLAQVLGVDRRFALLIAQGLEKATQDIVKEAQKGRQEAIRSLEVLGFSVNPLTGRVEPTLAARGKAEQARQFEVSEARRGGEFAIRESRAERGEVRVERREERILSQFQAQQELREAQFSFTQAKTQIQLNQAQERIRISEENLVLAKEREARITEQAKFLYTDTQLGRLRAFGIDPSDTDLADTLIFKGEPEYKKLLQLREKQLAPPGLFSPETFGQLGFDVFSRSWKGISSFFGF